jgi:hydroxypyruvate reductase
MSNLTQLRMAAREIFDEALRAVDAGDAVRRNLQLSGQHLVVCGERIELKDRRIFSIAIGKAAPSMARALEEILPERLAGGLLSGPGTLQSPQSANRKLSTLWQVHEGGHPLPNEQSLAAGKTALAMMKRANEEAARLIFLVSGGGSAMLEWPVSDEISLEDLRVANKVLVNSGASISEINAVRRAFSAVKGGKLADLAPNCDQITLIVSDVLAGQEWNVASGPTLSPPPNASDARELIEKYQLRSAVPPAILNAIDANSEKRATPLSESAGLREHFVLLNNGHALEAAANAARRRGFSAEIARDISDEPIQPGCEKLIQRLSEIGGETESDNCLVSGGEFACPVRGDGLGGRNVETALRLACTADLSLSNTGDFVALCAGTDGIDGNSPAAGALVDSTTMQRAKAIGIDPHDFLARSDAYSFFVALGDVINTGPTGTNVRDLRLLLHSAQRKPADT